MCVIIVQCMLITGFPGSSACKESACNAGDHHSIPRSGRAPGEGIGYPIQYSWASLVAQLVKAESACNAEDLASIPGLGRSTGQKETDIHSSILAWRIPTNRGAWQATVHWVTKSLT